MIKQSSTAYPLCFLMIDSSDGKTGKTGLTVAVTLSKNGGSFASPAGAVTEIGNGWYKVAGNATDSATLGLLILHASASGADPTDRTYEVIAYDPQAASNLGLANLDAAVSSRGTSTYAGADTAGTTTLLSRIGSALTIAGGKVAATLGATDYSGNTAQSGDAYARLGAAGAGLTALGDARMANLDAAVSSRGTSTYAGADTAGTTTLLSRIGSALTIAGGKVAATLGATDYSGNTVQTGDAYARLGAAGAGLTALGDARLANLDAAVSSRGTSTYAGADTAGTTTLLSRIGSALTIAGGKVAATLGATDYSGNTVQSGDAYARLGAAGAGLTALGDVRLANLDAAVSSRLATSGYSAGVAPAVTMEISESRSS